MQENGPHRENETKVLGVCASQKDANNKVMRLYSDVDGWEAFQEGYGEALYDVDKDGKISREATKRKGDTIRGWIEKQLLIKETGDAAKKWGSDKPGGEGETSESDSDSESRSDEESE